MSIYFDYGAVHTARNRPHILVQHGNLDVNDIMHKLFEELTEHKKLQSYFQLDIAITT